MTDNEIILGFDCCIHGWCDERCPYYGRGYIGYCVAQNGEDLLGLVKQQQAEIERLTINMNAFGLGMKREAEKASNARAEAITEFAQRLKEVGIPVEGKRGFEGVFVLATNFQIDNLVKEMVGEYNG